MSRVRLTKRMEFAAAHRYQNDAWDAGQNRAKFGACNNLPGHGHNYLVEVTVAGEVDECTGMVVNLYDLKEVLKQVLEEFDHKHLNLDTPYFATCIPTTENIARVLWRLLAQRSEIGTLEKIRLFEDEDLFAEVAAEDMTDGGTGNGRASVTRQYEFSASYPVPSESGGKAHAGHNYLLQVTVQGDINPETGMVTDLTVLDRLVRDRVVQRFHRNDLSQLPELASLVPTGEHLVRVIWQLLANSISEGRLRCARLIESPGCTFEYGE